jgi:DNA-binding beta-propeller fold protein YncE
MKRAASVVAITLLLAWAAIGASAARAYRPLLSEAYLKTTYCIHCTPPSDPHPELAPPSEGELEDPCGLAIASGGDIYVADYYHRAVDVFSSGGAYLSQIALPGGPISGLDRNELDGVCGLAIDAAGNLYANEWHEGVLRLRPSEFKLDSGESTGVAVDSAGNVFVNDRTYVAEYEAPVQEGAKPVARIGAGPLGDAYGIAISPSGERIYVADAASGEVEVFEPAVDADNPVATMAPPLGFTSLVDSALAVDPTNGHLVVLDDLQPGYEHPEAAVDEFEADGTYLGQIRGPVGAPIVDAEPSGLAVNAAGNLFVTDGNSELGNAFEFGPDPPGDGPAGTGTEAELAAAGIGRTPVPAPAPAGPGEGAAAKAPRKRRAAPARASNVIQHGKVRVAVDAQIAPRKLPRRGTAPIHFALSVKIASTDGSVPPQLRRISVAINRNGRIDPAGLPLCSYRDLQPSTTAGALAACRRSLIGEGSFAAKVLITQQAPFPSRGRIVAFNGRWRGRPAILAHIYGVNPVPTSYTLPFVIGLVRHGAYGTTLSASLPAFTSKWGYVTAVSLELGRSFRARGSARSYLTAGCPAPPGFPGAIFSLSRATLGFAGRAAISETLSRSCKARDGGD